MRRSDREITNIDEIIRIIETCDVCRLALSHDNVPYIVPLNFGYEYNEGKLTLYFHGAHEGKKLRIISCNPVACFEMDCSHRLLAGENACTYTMEYESVIGSGIIKMCAEKEEKLKALRHLMKQYAKGASFHFPDEALDAVAVFRLEVSEFTGKRLHKSQD